MSSKMQTASFNTNFLPHGSLPQLISPYMQNLIEKTGGKNGPLGKQFIAQPEVESQSSTKGNKDPLIEDEHEVVPGLIYKYQGKLNKNGTVIYYGRVLWTITRFCAAYCRFCTRGREVGLPAHKILNDGGAIGQKPFLDILDINKVFNYLKKHKEINEVILSGGDPLACPQKYLQKIIKSLVKLQREKQITIIRIGTRVPITNPDIIQNRHYQLIKEIENPYLMVHINHPDELTNKALAVLKKFRNQCQAIIMSQSVLLKGVNDSKQVLYKLFTKMAQNGIRPYYIYQNDPVYWAKHFTVPIKKAIDLWQKLRPKLSGISATARFVIDTPFGYGKIPIPEGGAWKVDYSSFYDFKKKKFVLQ